MAAFLAMASVLSTCCSRSYAGQLYHEEADLAAAYAQELQEAAVTGSAKVPYGSAAGVREVGPRYKFTYHLGPRRLAVPLVLSDRSAHYGIVTQSEDFYFVERTSGKVIKTKSLDKLRGAPSHKMLGSNPYGSLVGPITKRQAILFDMSGTSKHLYALAPPHYNETSCAVPLEEYANDHHEQIFVAPVPGRSRVLITGGYNSQWLLDVDLAWHPDSSDLQCTRSSAVQVPFPTSVCTGGNTVWRARPLDERWAVLECVRRYDYRTPWYTDALFVVDRQADGPKGFRGFDVGEKVEIGTQYGKMNVVTSVGADGMLVFAHGPGEDVALMRLAAGAAQYSRMSWAELIGCEKPDCKRKRDYSDAGTLFDVGDASRARLAVRFEAKWGSSHRRRLSLAIVEWDAEGRGFARRLYHYLREPEGLTPLTIFPSGVGNKLLVEWAKWGEWASMRETRLWHNQTIISPATTIPLSK